MGSKSVLGYCLSEIGFLSAGSLTYRGVHSCYVTGKEIHKQNMKISSSSRYHLELSSESGSYKGIAFVRGDEYENARMGKSFGNYGIVTNKNGDVRFSKKQEEYYAIRDVTNTAKKIVVQTAMVFLFLGIPTFAYLAFIISNFF